MQMMRSPMKKITDLQTSRYFNMSKIIFQVSDWQITYVRCIILDEHVHENIMVMSPSYHIEMKKQDNNLLCIIISSRRRSLPLIAFSLISQAFVIKKLNWSLTLFNEH